MTKITKTIIFIVLLTAVGALTLLMRSDKKTDNQTLTPSEGGMDQEPQESLSQHPMAIEALRKNIYPGSKIVIEETLSDGSNYKQYVASYFSEGLKIYGLLTIPKTTKPNDGFPAVVFLHGYIPPDEYTTKKNYAAYQAYLARNPLITFKIDLRGHGNSEGEAVTAHFSEKYVIDTLNAISSLKQNDQVDPKRIGIWGHSNGGQTGLRVMTVSKDVKTGVLWAGVVGSFEDMLETYNEKIPFLRNRENQLVTNYGLPSTNPDFWNKIDPYSYLPDIPGPIQLHHGTADASVPVELSIRLEEELEKAGKTVEYFEYRGDDHNIKNNLSLAWQRSIDFFLKNL